MRSSAARGPDDRHPVRRSAAAGACLLAASLGAGIPAASAANSGFAVSRIPGSTTAALVAADAVTNTIYQVDSGTGVTVIDGVTGSVTATISAPGAGNVAVDPATDTVYVTLIANYGGNKAGGIDVVDGATSKVTATLAEPRGLSPGGIAVDSSADMAYVTNPAGHSVTIINGSADAVSSVVSTGSSSTPDGIAVDEPSDLVWVADATGSLIEINGATDGILHTISLGAGSKPGAVAVDPGTHRVYAGDVNGNDVAVVDGPAAKVVGTIPVGRPVADVAVDPTAGLLYATSDPTASAEFGTTSVIDVATSTVTDTLARGGDAVAADPATGTAYESAGRWGGMWVITPAAANANSPVITSTVTQANFTAGVSASVTFTADALPAATFAEIGVLPGGITLSPAGALGGKAAADAGGVYPVTIVAGNGVDPAARNSVTVTVQAPAVITSRAVATFQAGTAGSFALTATGYPAPDFSEYGQLPAGVTLEQAATGWEIAGIPAAGSGGVYNFDISAFNRVGNSASQAFTLTVREAPRIRSQSATFLAGTRGTYNIPAYGFPIPTFAATGKLPYGLKLLSDGALTGTPGRDSGGRYHVTITASNGAGPASAQAFMLTVNQAPGITSARRGTFRAGHRRTFTIVTTGFPRPRLSERGRLPEGVRFEVRGNGTAVLTGVPARADAGHTYVLRISARNAAGVHRQTFRLTIS